MNITQVVNEMTEAQYIKLLQIASPVTKQEREEFSRMANRDLLDALFSE